MIRAAYQPCPCRLCRSRLAHSPANWSVASEVEKHVTTNFTKVCPKSYITTQQAKTRRAKFSSYSAQENRATDPTIRSPPTQFLIGYPTSRGRIGVSDIGYLQEAMCREIVKYVSTVSPGLICKYFCRLRVTAGSRRPQSQGWVITNRHDHIHVSPLA